MFSFIRRLNFSQNINLKERHTHPRNMNVDDDGVTDSSPNCDRNGEENGSTEMSGVLMSLQSSLKQLLQASKAATSQLLDASNGHSPKSLPNNSCPDEGTNNDFLDSLTQALLPNSKKSPDVEEKIAGLVKNILTGELSQNSVKKRGEKYPPPANCKYLTATMVMKKFGTCCPERTGQWINSDQASNQKNSHKTQ